MATAEKTLEELADEPRLALPPLKWAGGKRSLLPTILEHVPKKFGTYFEPFVGGGALFFALRSAGRIERACLNDTNTRLIRTYRAIQGLVGVDLVEGVIARLRRMKNDEAFFYRTRARKIDKLEDVDVAAWMIYLNRTCFNGLYRVNKDGGFNSPFGKYANPMICNALNLRACAWALGGAEGGDRIVRLTHDDFLQGMLGSKQGDFAYFDPPYMPRTGEEFVGYDAAGFGLKEHTRLRDIAWHLKNRGVHVLISNSGADEVRELYKKFTLHEVKGKRTIGSTGARRGVIPDLLIT